MGFIRYRSRVSSKRLASSLPVSSLDVVRKKKIIFSNLHYHSHFYREHLLRWKHNCICSKIASSWSDVTQNSEVTTGIWKCWSCSLQIALLLALHFPLSSHSSDLRFRNPGIVYEACVGSVLLVAYEKTEFDTVASPRLFYSVKIIILGPVLATQWMESPNSKWDFSRLQHGFIKAHATDHPF